MTKQVLQEKALEPAEEWALVGVEVDKLEDFLGEEDVLGEDLGDFGELVRRTGKKHSKKKRNF